MKVAVVGATGLVGQEILRVLEERDFPVSELIPVASKDSVGSSIVFKDRSWTVVSMEDAIAREPVIALFSAGGETALLWAPEFAAVGCRVIDNSSAWRMDPEKKLIVPEVNGDILEADDLIIANPNCSTIQLVVALKPLHDEYGVDRVVVSTYQSITGTGVKAVKQLEAERNGQPAEMVYPHPIDKNCIPHCDVFLENAYSKEEMKLVSETKKILDPYIRLTATAVRVPVVGGHSESVNVEFRNDFDLQRVKQLLSNGPGIVLEDDPVQNQYPMPINAAGKDDVFVGRVRRDESQPRALNMWVVADNLRKGAATNAVQIAEILIAKGIVDPIGETI
jgi:aspartate-semialdehyde dehydrogenase